MQREKFKLALRAYYRRKPFQPFTLELVSGGRIQVTHPEALMEQHGLLVCCGANGIHQAFEIESITRFIQGLDTA